MGKIAIMSTFYLYLVASLTWLTAGEIAEHRVLNLPGLDGPLAKSWSGYIPVPLQPLGLGDGVVAQVHYLLVENSKGDPDAPTISWNQGGPGGSSMLGLFTEVGPWTLNDYSFHGDSGNLTVFSNPNSWHQLGNVLFIELPAPTGFSKCDPSPDACRWNDTSQALVSYAFMTEFFSAYPELSHNPLYMTGESYAGVLVPTLAARILAHKSADNAHLAPWNLRGVALGNACPGNRVHTCTPYSGWVGAQTAVDFRYFHGMISEATYQAIQKACKEDWGRYEKPRSKECEKLLGDPIRPVMYEAGDTDNMGGGYFIYDTCHGDLGGAYRQGLSIDIGELQSELAALHRRRELADLPRPNSGEYMCGQERASLMYLNQPKVQEALNVRRTKFQFSTALEYDFTAHSLLDLYKDTLIDEIDVLQYSGDADPCVPYVGTQRWIDTLGLEVREPWSPWQPPGSSIPAGYLKIHNSYNRMQRFSFATVRDAGHMSPRAKGRQVLFLIRSFLNRFDSQTSV